MMKYPRAAEIQTWPHTMLLDVFSDILFQPEKDDPEWWGYEMRLRQEILRRLHGGHVKPK